MLKILNLKYFFAVAACIGAINAYAQPITICVRADGIIDSIPAKGAFPINIHVYNNQGFNYETDPGSTNYLTNFPEGKSGTNDGCTTYNIPGINSDTDTEFQPVNVQVTIKGTVYFPNGRWMNNSFFIRTATIQYNSWDAVNRCKILVQFLSQDQINYKVHTATSTIIQQPNDSGDEYATYWTDPLQNWSALILNGNGPTTACAF
jgi:hypothetical protein